MKRTLFAVSLLLILAANPNSQAQTSQTQNPLFSNAVIAAAYAFDNTMPTSLSEVAYIGQAPRTMFDWFYDELCQNHTGGNAIPVEFDAYVFQAAYSDSSIIEFLVNPEFGSRESAEKEVLFYAESLGRIPAFLRDGISVDLHAGDCGMGAVPGNFLIYSGFIKERQSVKIGNNSFRSWGGRGHGYANPNQVLVEGILIHEGAHSALDQLIKDDPEWKAAQQADGEFISRYAKNYPQNEDIAESFVAWMVLRYGKSVLATYELAITEEIPNRIAYFDKMFIDSEWDNRFTPFPPPRPPKIDQDSVKFSNAMLSRLADLKHFEGLQRVPRKDLAELVSTLMDWPVYRSKAHYRHLTSSDGIPSHVDILIEALTEFSYRNPSEEELAELPGFLMSDKVYKARLKTLYDLLSAPIPELNYKFVNPFRAPNLLMLNAGQLDHIITELLNFPENIIGYEALDLWEEILLETGIEYDRTLYEDEIGIEPGGSKFSEIGFQLSWIRQDIMNGIINQSTYYPLPPLPILSPDDGIINPSKFSTFYPLPRFTPDARLVIPFMDLDASDFRNDVILELPVFDAEIYNHQASLRNYIWSLPDDFGPDGVIVKYRAELTLKNIENEIDFDISQLIEFPFWRDANGWHTYYYAARLSLTEEVPQTLLLIIPVLETDIGYFYIELKYPELTLHHFRELK